MIKHILIAFVLLLFPLQAWATERFVSPGGSGSTCSNGSPCSITTAIAATTTPGDIITMQNGQYNTNVYINCSAGPASGTSGSPITLRAQNERQAFIQGNGQGNGAFHMINCSYWIVSGLHVANQDFNGSVAWGEAIVFENADHVTVTRNIAEKPNRYINAHCITTWHTTNMTITENEVYSCHRHGITLGYMSGGYVARNYGNRRDSTWPQINGVNVGGGSTGITCYPCDHVIIANNIMEGWVKDSVTDQWGYGFDVTPPAGGCALNSCVTGTKWLGNISLNSAVGFWSGGRDGSQMVDGVYLNNVAIGCTSRCWYARSPRNLTMTNNSGFGTATGDNINSDDDSTGNSTFSINGTNNLALNSLNGYGIVVAGGAGWSGTWDHNLERGNNPNTSMGANITLTNNSNAADAMGNCTIYIPSTATNLKGKGASGADIGANVLYQYNPSGNLTSIPLWDASGWIVRGATVAGVNDVAGNSLYDVHTRVNAGVNGCALPAAGPTVVITTPASDGTIVSLTPTTVSGTSSLP